LDILHTRRRSIVLGDVVLTYGRSKSSFYNVLLQRLSTFNFSSPAYSHVALLTGQYKAVHAQLAPNHVESVLIHELCPPGTPWAVWRHREFSRSIHEDERSWHSHHWYTELFSGERYNSLYLVGRVDRSFCSELVGKAYERYGYPFACPPHRLFPMEIH